MKRLYLWLIDLFKVYELEFTIDCFMSRKHQDILDMYLLTDGRKLWIYLKHIVSKEGLKTRVTVYIKGRKRYDWAAWQFLQAIKAIDRLLQEESKEAS